MGSDQHLCAPVLCSLPGSCHFISMCILPSRFSYCALSNVKGLRCMEVGHLPQAPDRVFSQRSMISLMGFLAICVRRCLFLCCFQCRNQIYLQLSYL